MAESIKNQVDALTGFGNTEDLALQDWCESGVKELINLFPPKLKEKCATISGLTDANGLDVDGVGEILYVTRETGDSTTYYAPCRKISSMRAGMIGDSTEMMYYPSVTDPVYWVESNASDIAKLFVKPDPTGSQDAKIYHVSYPQVNLASSVIGNFPDEAEYLVVLYASSKALQRLMNNLVTNSDITTALSAMTTELNKVDDIIVEASAKIDAYYTSIGDIDDTTELWDNTNKRFKEVRDALLMAKETVDVGWGTDEDSGSGNDVTGIKSVGYWLDDEDSEMAQATIQAANLELQRAQASIAEINSIMASYKMELDGVPLHLQEASSYISQAQGYMSEANARMQNDAQKYQWYKSQQETLKQEYQQGVMSLLGQGMKQAGGK